MRRDTILFDINETVLDLSSLKPLFAKHLGSEAVTATWFSMLLHTSNVCSLTGVRSDFGSLAGAMLDTLAARILEQEHQLYPESVRRFFAGLTVEGRTVRDGTPVA